MEYLSLNFHGAYLSSPESVDIKLPAKVNCGPCHVKATSFAAGNRKKKKKAFSRPIAAQQVSRVILFVLVKIPVWNYSCNWHHHVTEFSPVYILYHPSGFLHQPNRS